MSLKKFNEPKPTRQSIHKIRKTFAIHPSMPMEVTFEDGTSYEIPMEKEYAYQIVGTDIFNARKYRYAFVWAGHVFDASEYNVGYGSLRYKDVYKLVSLIEKGNVEEFDTLEHFVSEHPEVVLKQYNPTRQIHSILNDEAIDASGLALAWMEWWDNYYGTAKVKAIMTEEELEEAQNTSWVHIFKTREEAEKYASDDWHYCD